MLDDDKPQFETKKDVGGRPLVICTYKGHRGAARIFSAGEEHAKGRAEAEARAKAARATTND